MAITSDTETRQTAVTVRVPNGADGDLTTNAQRRLSRADGNLAVSVDELCGLQPGLSATDVTVSVTVEADGAPGKRPVEEALSALAGVEMVDLGY